MFDFIMIWTGLSGLLAFHPYFVFEKPWFGKDRVWWSMVIHLPLVLASYVVPYEKMGSVTGDSDEYPSKKFNWSSIRF